MICAECPFRRDAPRLGDAALEFYKTYCFDGWQIYHCARQHEICLGHVVYLHNITHDEILPEEWRGYERDEELVFSSNGEFLRYHWGEYHGSTAWRREWRARCNFPADDPEDSRRPEADGEAESETDAQLRLPGV